MKAYALVAMLAVGFFIRDTTDGMYRICYYNVNGSEVATTTSIGRLCPLTIEV